MTQWQCRWSRTPQSLKADVFIWTRKLSGLCMCRNIHAHISHHESAKIQMHTYITSEHSSMYRSSYVSRLARKKTETQTPITSSQCQMCRPHTNTQGLDVCPLQSQEVSPRCFLSPHGGCVPPNKDNHHHIEFVKTTTPSSVTLVVCNIQSLSSSLFFI